MYSVQYTVHTACWEEMKPSDFITPDSLGRPRADHPRDWIIIDSRDLNKISGT